MTSPRAAFSSQQSGDFPTPAHLDYLLSLPFSNHSAQLWLESAERLAASPVIGLTSPLFDPMLRLFENIAAIGLISEAYQLYRLSSLTKYHPDNTMVMIELGNSARRSLKRLERAPALHTVALSDQVALANFVCEYAVAENPYQRQRDLDRMGILSHMIQCFSHHEPAEKASPAPVDKPIDLTPYIQQMNMRKVIRK
jgi:hypothetical protein